MKTFRKTLSLFTIGLIVVYFAFETISYFGFWIGTGKKFRFSEITREKTRRVSAAESLRSNQSLSEAKPSSLLAPHPYLGFVYHPAYNLEESKAVHGVPISEWGFLDDKPPLLYSSDDHVVIGIFGGSAAFWLSVQGNQPLLAELAKVPEFKENRLVVVRTALGGFKQPQQLMTLNYLLALGGQFDIVINLDGLNEVALAPAWVRQNGMFPHFPRDWANLMSQVADFELVRRLGVLNIATEWRSDWASLFLRPGLRHSVTLNTVWKLMDRILEARMELAKLRVDAYTSSAANKSIPYPGRGPARNYPDTDSMYADLVAVWERCSWQMYTLSKGNNIRYYHFLQPSQYLEGSLRD